MLIIGLQWPTSGAFLIKIHFPYICLALCFLVCGLRTKTDEITVAFKSYKAIVWGILTILLVVPITGTQITKTIQFATMMTDNMTTSESAVVGNVTAIGPTEFAFALQVFFVVPASMSAGAILVRTELKLIRFVFPNAEHVILIVQGPVSQKSRNFSGQYRVPQFPLYLRNAEVLSLQTSQSS